MKMKTADRDCTQPEIERLRLALDAETLRCLDVQRRLDRANAEFEEFVSMAAHNLRERLREVASYSQLIAEANADCLDSEALAMLGRIREDAAGMQSLTTDVVDFWAAGAGDARSSRTDMEGALRQALFSANRQIVERGATVTHDPLPAVMGDFESLSRVLRHLIKNAIEYCDTPSPQVHISSRQDDFECTFSVQDNGPGIDPAFQTRIFGAFKRLHGREFPGNGLGLAFCKKTVEGLGGRLSVKSTQGAGSTFYFTLPVAD
jgi:chemotaxis family two-component system sensor kinase Cph1